jgi:regulator of replication initiation timing
VADEEDEHMTTKILPRDEITPKHFGVVGDGVTDDTAAMKDYQEYMAMTTPQAHPDTDIIKAIFKVIEATTCHIGDHCIGNEENNYWRAISIVETLPDRIASLSAQVEALTKERDELRGEVADLIEDGNDLRSEIRHYQREYGRLEAQVEALSKALAECADDLEASVNAEYAGTLDYPSMMRKFERDMEPVVRARAALSAPSAPALSPNALREAKALKALEYAQEGIKMTDKTVLWCCHVRGPDDVYAAPDYATALAWADELNSAISTKFPPKPDEPVISAVPAPWPWSSESHASDLIEQIAMRKARQLKPARI